VSPGSVVNIAEIANLMCDVTPCHARQVGLGPLVPPGTLRSWALGFPLDPTRPRHHGNHPSRQVEKRWRSSESGVAWAVPARAGLSRTLQQPSQILLQALAWL
jgi:hypothetical protein